MTPCLQQGCLRFQPHPRSEHRAVTISAVSWFITYESLDDYLEKGPQVGLYDNRLTIRGIKMSIDGAVTV